MNAERIYDCVIIGGGVIGCFCARELSAYKGDFLLLEKGNDVAVGTSKANSGIVHAGFDAECGTLKAKYNVAGARVMEKKCAVLSVPYKRNGALVVSLGGDEKLVELMERGRINGAETELISGDAARVLEPNLSAEVTHALYAPSSAIVSPYELTVACYENFIANGGSARFNARVDGIARSACGYVIALSTPNGTEKVSCKTIINAAGLYSAEINNMACSVKRSIRARRGQYMLLDKKAKTVKRTVFRTPTALGKGVLVAPTCHGNTLIGPSAEDVDDISDVSTTYDGLEQTFNNARLSVPSLSKRDIITQFAGNRAIYGDDFCIEESEDGFFNALGICSPGLASSPAIAEKLSESVASKLGLKENDNFVARRAAIPCFAELSNAERDELIKSDPRFGRIICRCETVTEGEIVEAIRRGAVDLDGIKRRVRAGMGRCQAGFCTANLLDILARERGVDVSSVTKSGGRSFVAAPQKDGGEA